MTCVALEDLLILDDDLTVEFALDDLFRNAAGVIRPEDFDDDFSAEMVDIRLF